MKMCCIDPCSVRKTYPQFFNHPVRHVVEHRTIRIWMGVDCSGDVVVPRSRRLLSAGDRHQAGKVMLAQKAEDAIGQSCVTARLDLLPRPA